MSVSKVRLCASSICQLRCPVCVGWGIREMGYSSVAEWEEAQRDYGKRHLAVCENLWNEPQINWDGRLLGCPCNCDFFAVNVFESGLEKALANEDYVYAKQMVLGKANPRDDVPCSVCDIYRYRRAHGVYLDEKTVEPAVPA
ncbi:MAG: hypothetical protein KA419_10235 [Acidobacteria bacterium]|nr:hypothetical protein [Acidobacteriota bacterium]